MNEFPRYIKWKDQLSILFNDMGLVGEGVEVGVNIGNHCAKILELWNGRLIHLIDPWVNKDNTFNYVQNRFRNNTERVKIHRLTSVEASKLFDDNSLDWVYLDGDHSYSSVCADLISWYPKVKSGGVISGHDYFIPGGGYIGDCNYLTGRKKNIIIGAFSAVNTFGKILGWKVYKTRNRVPTFYTLVDKEKK